MSEGGAAVGAATPPSAPAPAVDVVVPVRDEARHLADAVAAIGMQDYAGTLRILLAVAPSTDGTETVAARLAAGDDRITVVANPSASTPAALNAAIAVSRAPIVARVDGHCRLAPGYITRAVATLTSTGAANVGGVQRAVGRSSTERAIAAAMSSRFGTGGARFHVGGRAGPVDTVYLGVYRRDALERAGGFDETLLRNQDYELNIRLRQAGEVVWFDPGLWASYRPRGSYGALARQYFQYGQYKRRVLAMHPRSLRVRQALPPIACATAVAGAVAGLRWRRALVAPLGYVAALGIAAATTPAGGSRRAPLLSTVAALATIHFAWSAGLVAGVRHRAGGGTRR